MLNYRYQIKEKLGEGGTGTVFLCEDTLQGAVLRALKVLHAPGPDSPRSNDAFRNEVSILSTLTHPHLVAVTDFGIVRSCDDYPDLIRRDFLITEYVRGRDALLWAKALPAAAIRGELSKKHYCRR